MIVVDCGKNTATIFDSEKGLESECKVVAHEDILSLPENLPKGSTVVCEYAHMGCPRTRFSKSMPFKAEVLLDLYERFEANNITLKLFPQMSTPRACSYSGLPKNDLNDPKSIYILIKDFPEIELMDPPKSFTPSRVRQESYPYKKVTSGLTNCARGSDNKYSDGCSNFIMEFAEELCAELSDKTKEVFGLTDESRYAPKTLRYYSLAKNYEDKLNKKISESQLCVIKKLESSGELEGNEIKSQCNLKGFSQIQTLNKNGILELREETPVPDFNFNSSSLRMAGIYAVVCTLMDEEGKVRVRTSTGKMSGWQWIKRYILRMSPYHFKGGTARSNLYYHLLMAFIAAKGKEHGLDFKRKVKFIDDNGEEQSRTIRRGNFTPEEDKVFLKYRSQFSFAVKQLFQKTKKLIEGKLLFGQLEFSTIDAESVLA